MSVNRNGIWSFLILTLMLSAPWAAADISGWAGPPVVSSDGQTRNMNGWDVPGNATVLDAWLDVSDVMTSDGNGTKFEIDTPANFTQGLHTDTTPEHFGGLLSLQPDSAVSDVDSFPGNVAFTFATGWSFNGNQTIWAPKDPSTLNGSVQGGTKVTTYGNIPATAKAGSIVAATLPGSPVPGGVDASLVSPSIQLPSPIQDFNLTFWHWYHVDGNAGDAVWVEMRLDNGNWFVIEPDVGYNANKTVGNVTHGAWSGVNHTGWQEATFNLDNITGIANATNADVRFRIITDVNSTGRPGWFIDDIEIINIGASTGYWHHGCYNPQATTCGYSNNADGALEVTGVNLSSAGNGATLQTRLEWDLEGSSYDNFHVEMKTGTGAWTALTQSAGIPNFGYTVGGTQYGDETNGFVLLDLAIPQAFQGQSSVDLRYRVDTDSSVTSGGMTDNREGLTLDWFKVLNSNGTTLLYDPLSSTTLNHYGVGGAADDWAYTLMGAGQLQINDGFEGSQAGAPGGLPAGWSATGDWEFGPLNAQPTTGPNSFPTGPFGFGTDLDGDYSGSNWDHLYSPEYQIPLGASARLTFSHWMCAETNWDGGAVYISTNNQTWTHFSPVLANGSNWYDSTGTSSHTGSNLNSLGNFNGQNSIPAGGWSCEGPHNLWETKVADVSNYAGGSVWFRFSFESDGAVSRDGWYIDDVGIEIDWFLDDGTWVSPPIQTDDLGLGFVDADVITPNGTWVAASVTDAGGTVIPGYDNLSLPISLHGLDTSAHSSIRVRLNLGTNDPLFTPLVSRVQVGSVLYMDGLGPAAKGWQLDAGLVTNGVNLTNPTNGILYATLPFVESSRPITSAVLHGVGSQANVRLLTASGAVVGNAGLTGTLAYPMAQPGLGVQVLMQPGASIRNLTIAGVFGQPGENPEVDVLGDGSVEWSFPMGDDFGHHGWQTFIAERTDTSGTQALSQAQSTNIVFGPGSATLKVLIPADAMVHTAVLSARDATNTFQGQGVDVSVGIASAQTMSGSGMAELIFSSHAIQAMNAFPGVSTHSPDRDWREVEIDFASTAYSNLDIAGLTIAYTLVENVTGLTSDISTYHQAAIAGGGVENVGIPVTMVADDGGIALDGGIYHELMMTNHPFSPPGTMYPDGTTHTVTTRHHHLYENADIASILFTGRGSDGQIVQMLVEDPSATPTFSQPMGAELLTLDTTTSMVTEVGGVLEVDWNFMATWAWDDVTSIEWSALARNASDGGIAPARASTGGQGSQAIENDLEIHEFRVETPDGFELSNAFHPDYPFHQMTGAEVSISGSVRFQNTAGLRPLQPDFTASLNLSGAVSTLVSDGDGTFSGLAILPENLTQALLSPAITRIGPISGSVVGANDSTVSAPVVDIRIDDTPPTAGPLLVSTSRGLLDADGYVWDPSMPLSVRATIEDGQDRASEVTLNYWREGYDDANADGIPQADEYQQSTKGTFGLRSGSEQVVWDGIPVTDNGFNGRVSMYISGTDWAGNTFQANGTGGAPGFDADWATLQVATNAETVLIATGMSINTVGEHLLAGQTHTLTLTVQDANGVSTLDDIAVYLAGEGMKPFGEFHYDPRQDTFETPEGSQVTPGDVRMIQLTDDTARLEVDFSIDWDTEMPDGWMVPGIVIQDDEITVANVNNLMEMRWKLDNTLEAVITDMSDLTAPLAEANASLLHLRVGDEFSIDGIVRYAETGAVLPGPVDGIEVSATVWVGSTEVTQTVSTLDSGAFHHVMVLPTRAPVDPLLPIELAVLNVPGLGEGLSGQAAALMVDSDAPVLLFDPYRFPASSLTMLESDRLENVRIDVIAQDVGGMAEGPLVMTWQYLRNGLPLMGAGGSAEVAHVSSSAGEHHYGGDFDLTPKAGIKLADGDQVTFVFEGEDAAGNALVGEGTGATPRAPSLLIIEFIPVHIDTTYDPTAPEWGDLVTVRLWFDNQGKRAGSFNLTLAERIDTGVQPYETVQLNFSSMESGVMAEFEWEAWRSGATELFVVAEGDLNTTIDLPNVAVAKPVESGGFSGTTAMMAGGMVLMLVVIIALISVIIMRKPSDSYDYDDEDWDDDDELEVPEIEDYPLDFNNGTVRGVMESHGIDDPVGFLSFARDFDADQNGYLRIEELQAAARAFNEVPVPEPVDPEVEAVLAALPEWSETRAKKWMSKGWSAEQIIAHHAPQPEPEVQIEPEVLVEEEVQVEEESEPEIEEEPEVEEELEPLPTKTKLNKMKKAELVEFAEGRGVDSSGTKAAIIERLLAEND